jgi:hypothetical protein
MQRLDIDRKMAALAAPERGGDAHLDAELVRLAHADAFERVEALDLGAAVPAFLVAHPVGKVEQPGKLGL